MSLVPPGFYPKLVYRTKLLADDDSLSSIGYGASRGISFLCVRCLVAEAPPAAVGPSLPVIAVKVNPIDSFGAQPEPLDKHSTMRAFISSCIAEARVQEANPCYEQSGLHIHNARETPRCAAAPRKGGGAFSTCVTRGSSRHRCGSFKLIH